MSLRLFSAVVHFVSMLGLSSSYLLWFGNINWRFLLFMGLRNVCGQGHWWCEFFFFYGGVKSFSLEVCEDRHFVFFISVIMLSQDTYYLVICSVVVYCSVFWYQVFYVFSSGFVGSWLTRGGFGFLLIVR